jgi:uncharacterized protein (DUF342 family)
MESDWQQFSNLLEEKINERITPLEQHLEKQQELISQLGTSLFSILELLNKNSSNKNPPGVKENKCEKVTGKTEASENDDEKLSEPLG